MNEILVLSNPSRRGKRKGKRAYKAKRNASRRRSRKSSSRRVVRARRNPSIRGVTSAIVPTVKAGAFGAVGALGNDLLFGYGSKYLPAFLQSGVARDAAKILSAVLIGAVGNKVMPGKGVAFANGAATVAIHAALLNQIKVFAPTLPLGEYLEGYEYSDPAPQLSAYESDDLGAYMTQPSAVGDFEEG